MITPREIAKDLESVRKKMKKNITTEDIDVIFDLLANFYKSTKESRDFQMKLTKMYKELYCKYHHISKDAIVEWRFEA